MNDKDTLYYYVILSIISAFLVLLLSFFGSQEPKNISLYDRAFVGGLFIIICIVGISFAARPRWYKRKKTSTNSYDKNNSQTKKSYKGHHPDCKYFKNHTITIKNRIYCSGCLGLILGSLIAIVLIIFYIPLATQKYLFLFQLLLIFGIVIIFLVYAEIILQSNATIHFISNIFFVLSFFFIVISIFEITGDRISGFIGILFSFLWVNTRINFSHWNHKRICSCCNENCKMY